MTEDNFRRIGALIGLAAGMLALYALVRTNSITGTPANMITGAVLGAGGAVLGGMFGERVFANLR